MPLSKISFRFNFCINILCLGKGQPVAAPYSPSFSVLTSGNPWPWLSDLMDYSCHLLFKGTVKCIGRPVELLK